MLDDLAFSVEAKDVNASSFLAGPVQVTHVYEGQISIDGDTLHLAGNAAGLLDVGNDAVNPLFPNGLDGIIAYIKQAGSIPCEVKRIAIDGDLAFIHVRYLNWAGKETAGVDIFRFDAEGKIVEHWDVLQPVPASSNNPNTMF